MIVKLKNVWPFRTESLYDLNGDCVIEGTNGKWKTTLIDSIWVAFYWPYNEKKKDTKRLFSLNEPTQHSFVEIQNVEFCWTKYWSIKRDIFKKWGGKFDQKLIVDWKSVDSDFFEKILPLDRYLLMTNYSYFYWLTSDEKIIALNSFFDIDNFDVFNSLLKENLPDIEKKMKEILIKLDSSEEITETFVKKAFVSVFDRFWITKEELGKLWIDNIKDLSLSAGRDMKKVDKEIEDLFIKIKNIPKSTLSADSKEEILKKLNDIKTEKSSSMKDIETLSLFEILSKVTKLNTSLKEWMSIDWNNKWLIFWETIINTQVLNAVKSYVNLKEELIGIFDTIEEKINKTSDPIWEGYSTQEDIMWLIKLKNDKKYKALIENLKVLLNDRENTVTTWNAKEKLEDPLLVSLYNWDINFSKDGKELNWDDKNSILNFIKSKFVTEDQLKKFGKWMKVSTVLKDLVNNAEYTLSRMTKIYNDQLNFSDKNILTDLLSNADDYNKLLENISELRGEYINALKSTLLKESGSVENFVNENKKRLSFVNKESIWKKIELLDKDDFEYVTKLKNFEKNEVATNSFLKLTQDYKSLLKLKEGLTAFEFLTSKFPKKVLEQNFVRLNHLIEESSNGLLTINNENKKTIELMYKKDDESDPIPYDNMSDGLQILSDNLLMSAIHKLQKELGKWIDFVVVDEISAVAPKNRKLLVNALSNMEWQKIVTITSDRAELGINDLNEFFWIEKTNIVDTPNNSENKIIDTVEEIPKKGKWKKLNQIN